MNDKREYIKLVDTKELYGIAPSTVRKWINRNPSEGVPKLEAFKPGRDILINRKTFELYIKRFPAA